jgi:uncharacterized protein YyaL (SSP411 family)
MAVATRLARAESTYLRQHRDQPVDWFPWGEEAFARARSLDRPLFVSIGYAACHWCHVMAHESFEDTAIAALLNEAFVPVKVDRQEHPEVDATYQTVCQAATGQGGWPLTVFLTPELEPFYVGTYFPPRARWGRPGLWEVLQGVARAWREDRATVLEVAKGWRRALERLERPPALSAAGVPAGADAEAAERSLAALWDTECGGFGSEPKFPHPLALTWLLRRGGAAAAHARATLRAMARGGIHDLVGGGFHRYAVDRAWRTPHFEKMLYDNALLVTVLVDAFRASGEPLFARLARRTVAYLLRTLRDPAGGFYSSEDADSPGPDGVPAEGAFYLWTRDELVRVVGAEAADLLGAAADGSPSVLRVPEPPPGEPDPLDGEALWHLLDRLAEVRSRRPRPERDELVLAGWNGLALSALAKAGWVLGEPGYLAAAEDLARLLVRDLRLPDGRLARCWYGGRAERPGHLEDYAFVAQGLFDLYQASLDGAWLREALRLATEAVDRFWDPERRVAYAVEGGRTDLLVRPRDLGDQGTPSAEVALATLARRLGPFASDPRLAELPEAVLARHRDTLVRYPLGLASALVLLDELAEGRDEVVLAWPAGDAAAEAEARAWHAHLGVVWAPRLLVSRWEPWVPSPPAWEGRGPVDGRATAWVCRADRCLPAAHHLEEVLAGLGIASR